jgi:propane monooxygenase small subunit
MQAAAPHGDFVTPAVIGTGEADAHREQRGARHLFELLITDEQFAAENRAQLQSWVDNWAPVSVRAARQLQPIWSQASEKVVTFEDSFDRSRSHFEGLLDDLGLTTPKEL